MTKRQLIDDIRRLNTSAQPQFLVQFDETSLKQYLDHLESAQRKHLRGVVGWSRPAAQKLRLVS